MGHQEIGSYKEKITLIDDIKKLGFKFKGDDIIIDDKAKLTHIGRKIPWLMLFEIVKLAKTTLSHQKEEYRRPPFVNNQIFCDTLQLIVNNDKKMELIWADCIMDKFITTSKSKPDKKPIKVTKDHIISLCTSMFGAHIMHIHFPPVVNYPAQWFICVLFILCSIFPRESQNDILIERGQCALVKMRRKKIDIQSNDINIVPVLDRLVIS
jgi:hypothetical protein